MQSEKAAALALIREREAIEARTLSDQHAADLEQSNYFQRVALVKRDLETKNARRAEETLNGCPEELRNWEWHYLKWRRIATPKVFEIGKDAGYWIAFHPDSRRVAVPTQFGLLELLDVNSGKKILSLQAATSDA